MNKALQIDNIDNLSQNLSLHLTGSYFKKNKHLVPQFTKEDQEGLNKIKQNDVFLEKVGQKRAAKANKT